MIKVFRGKEVFRSYSQDRRKGEGESSRSSRASRFDSMPMTHVSGERSSNSGVLLFSAVEFALAFALVILASWLITGFISLIALIVALIMATLFTMSLHIAQQWEKVVVLRFGKFNRVSGPGLFFTFPIIESNTIRIDDRIRSTTFGAEETLTSDLVSLDVNAVLFWLVWDAKAACTEVSDFSRSVELAAQTALRDAIGRAGAAEVAIRRNQLDQEIKHALEEKVASWGITILSIEIRDILMPPELQEIMSLEAQAEQRSKARVILMETEKDLCSMVDEMGDIYEKNESAMRLRAMHLLYESIRETGGTVVVPSSFGEGFGDILPKEGKNLFGA